MWDSGAKIGLITFSSARKLELRRTPINIHITKGGGDKVKIKSRSFHLPLLDEFGNVLLKSVWDK